MLQKRNIISKRCLTLLILINFAQILNKSASKENTNNSVTIVYVR